MAEVSTDYFQQSNESTDAPTVDYELVFDDASTSAEEFPPPRNPGQPGLGDPEPLTPNDESSAPPPGSGEPPISDPSFPGGPGLPA